MILKMPSQSKRKWLKRNNLIWFVVLILIVFGAVIVFRRMDLKSTQKQALVENALAPSVTSTPSEAPSVLNISVQSTRTISPELNLDVPFTSQAPTANWDAQHEENCEEASLLMANRYFSARGIDSAEDAESGMQQIIDWENVNLGVSDSIDAEQTSRIVKEFLNLKSEVLTNPSVEQIKQAIFDGKLVLVPASGRELKNPFFKQPGPLYHMLVIKGYSENKFITNDPGTRRGENYVYDVKTILDANHEWNGGDVLSGKAKIVVVSK